MYKMHQTLQVIWQKDMSNHQESLHQGILRTENATKRCELSCNDYKDMKDFPRGGDNYSSANGKNLSEEIQYEVDYYDAIQNLLPATKLKVLRMANKHEPGLDKFVDGFLKLYYSSDPKDRRNHRESL